MGHESRMKEVNMKPKSYWDMVKENFDSPGEIIPLMGFLASCVLLWYAKITGTEWLAAFGLCLTAHTINHAADENPPQ